MKSTLLSLLMAIGLSISAFAWAEPDYLVDADWLAEQIDDDNLVVLEVRYHPHRYHSVGHIPGAIQVKRFKDLADNQSLTVTRFPHPRAVSADAAQLGCDHEFHLGDL